MTRDDIIRMAKEADLWLTSDERIAAVERFANLVAAAIERPKPDARTRHKTMLAMMQAHWRSIDSQWKDDPELCHALGYEAGHNDAVAPRAEPRLGGSGAGFESLPASPHLTTRGATKC